MTPDSTILARALGPRAAIHGYVAQLAQHQRRLGLVPMDGRWVTLDARIAKLNRMKGTGRAIFLQLILLLLALAGVSLLFLLLTYYLAY